MLISINGLYFEAQPVPAPEGDYDVVLEKDRAIVTKGGKKIEYGAIFHPMGAIDPQTGQILMKNTQKRAIIDGKAIDFLV